MTVKNFKDISNEEYLKINRIALPLILNSVSSIIIGLCDQAMVGRTSLVAFGSVGLISTTVNSITGVLGMTSVAFNIIGARSKGEHDYIQLRNNFTLNILISIIIGLIFFFGTLKFGASLVENLYALKGGALFQASEYLSIFSLSLGLNMILFTFSSYFKIMNRTKNILYGNIVASISNILFDYILIFGHFGFPKMGAKGNALGSILALLLNLLVYIIAVRKDNLFKFSSYKLVESLKKTLTLSVPIMGQEMLESTLLVITINSILSRIGILEVSVYNLLLTIVSIASMPMYSYSQASLTIISEYLGAKSFKNIKETPRHCLLFAMLFYTILSIILLSCKDYIPSIITNDTQLIRNSVIYMPLVFLVNIFFIPSTVYKYSLQGMEDGKWVFLVSIIVNFIGVMIIFLFVEVLNLRLFGIYVGMSLNYIVQSLLLYYRYNTLTKKSLDI